MGELLRVRATTRNQIAGGLEGDTAVVMSADLDRDASLDGDVKAEHNQSERYSLKECTRCDNTGTKAVPIKISIADLIGEVPSALHVDSSQQTPSPASSPVPTTAINVPVRAALQQSVVGSACGWTTYVRWTIDAKKLLSKDNVIVSPSFDVAMERLLPFRMMLLPREVSDKKGGHCFKKARGAGSVQLKCEVDLEDIAFDTTVTFSLSTCGKKRRGPVTHDFAHAGVCGLPKGEQTFYFGDFIDVSSQTFSIELEAWTGRM